MTTALLPVGLIVQHAAIAIIECMKQPPPESTLIAALFQDGHVIHLTRLQDDSWEIEGDGQCACIWTRAKRKACLQRFMELMARPTRLPTVLWVNVGENIRATTSRVSCAMYN